MIVTSATWAMEMQFETDVWADVTDDVIIKDSVRYSSGLTNNSPDTRVASTGRMAFSLDNSDKNSAGILGYYSPGGSNVRDGFTTGMLVRLRQSYDGFTRTKFYGRIAKDGIVVEPGTTKRRRTKIAVLDYMNQISTHEMILPAYTTNKRTDEIMPLITGNMPLEPQSTSYDTGVETFVSVFDTVRSRTSAISEVSKLALSEWGFFYVKHDKDNDEVLRFENQNARDVATLTQIPNSSVDAGFLRKEEDDGYILQENGDKLIIEEAEDADFFNDTSTNPLISYGENLYNYIKITSYPRSFDAAATILYQTTNALSLDVGETRTFTGNFKDPNNEANRVAGKNMIAPVATTDYWLDTDPSGTVSDLTADLTLLHQYGANAGSYSATNEGTVDGYVWVQARGQGIYSYDPMEYISEDTDSQAQHGLQPLNIDMLYQDDPAQAETIGNFLVLAVRDPQYEVDRYTYWGNRDDEHMMAMVHLEIGDRIRITESLTGFDRDVYIDAIDGEVHPNNVFKCTYRTRFVSSLTGWQLENEGFSELGQTTVLG